MQVKKDMSELVAAITAAIETERRTHELLTTLYQITKDARGRAYTRGNIYKRMRKAAKEGDVNMVLDCANTLHDFPAIKFKV